MNDKSFRVLQIDSIQWTWWLVQGSSCYWDSMGQKRSPDECSEWSAKNLIEWVWGCFTELNAWVSRYTCRKVGDKLQPSKMSQQTQHDFDCSALSAPHCKFHVGLTSSICLQIKTMKHLISGRKASDCVTMIQWMNIKRDSFWKADWVKPFRLSKTKTCITS